jgi:pSer/pThr/pTyr-binding forkhead associated (FHA) protein
MRNNGRIVGSLLSYTHQPEGEMFAVREGHNLIGSTNVETDAQDRPVAVPLPEDYLVSAKHAMILVQRGQFYVEDLGSTNGTLVNGERLRPHQIVDLPSPSEIQVGDTVLIFVSFVLR